MDKPHKKLKAWQLVVDIAEGAGRNTKKEFVNFLHIAQGSLSELDTQLELSLRLQYIEKRHGIY